MDALLPTLPIHVTAARAAAVYLIVCALLRVIPKRQAGSISPQDIVGAVIVGGLAVEGIAQSDAGPADFVIMITVVLMCNFGLDWLADRFPALRRLIREPPTCLVRDGRIDRRALHKEMLAEDELLAQLRKQGVEDVNQVRSAHLEADGEVSVVRADG